MEQTGKQSLQSMDSSSTDVSFPRRLANEPIYQSTWIEIEELLYETEIEMNSQRAKFHIRKSQGSKEGKYRAVMKYQRAKGIVDTLRWILGERGQKSPLEERLGELNYLMR